MEADHQAHSAERRRLAKNEAPDGERLPLLPESVVEAVAHRSAVSAAHEHGPLAAASALARLFLVCSTWRNVSGSEMLWKGLCIRIWKHEDKEEQSWKREYFRIHGTARNLMLGRARHFLLSYNRSEDDSSRFPSLCKCLAISKRYLAGGFWNGVIRIFNLKTKYCLRTMRADREDRFGQFCRSIAGIALDDRRVIFASQAGDVYVGDIAQGSRKRMHVGNAIQDGALISFAGNSKWLVALYAGSPGHSIRVWNARTEKIHYSGANIMDNDAMRGWRSFVELSEQIGRLRLGSNSHLMVATRDKLLVGDLNHPEIDFNVVHSQELAIETVDVANDRLISATHDGIGKVYNIPSMSEVCTLRFRSTVRDDVFGALNSCQAFLSISGTIHAWEATTGSWLYRLEEELMGPLDMIANDTYIAASLSDSSVQLWDFSSQGSYC